MKTINRSADNVQTPNDTLQSNDAYRAPRLLCLGTAVELLQGSWAGRDFDSGQPPFRIRR